MASPCCATAHSCSLIWAISAVASSISSATAPLLPGCCDVDGVDLPPSNFVVEDAAGRFWITVSTRLAPRSLGYRRSCNDGFIVLVDGGGARIVADGLGYTNECVVDATGIGCMSTKPSPAGSRAFRSVLMAASGKREVVTLFGPGTFPDGLAQDAQGAFWITSIVSNRLIRVGRDGRQTIWLEDCDQEHLAWVEQAYQVVRDGAAAPGRGQEPCPAQYLEPCVRRHRLAHRLSRLPVGRLARDAHHARRRPAPDSLELSMSKPDTAPEGASLADGAYQDMRRRILDNVWAPGYQALEQEIALQLGMSRTPVREALIRLANEGLVEVIPRRGMRVLPVSLGDMRDIYQILTALESAAAEIVAARKPSDEELEPLVAATLAMEQRAGDRRPGRLGRRRRALSRAAGEHGRQQAAGRRGVQPLGPGAPRAHVHACGCGPSRSTRPRSTWRWSSGCARATPTGPPRVNREHRQRASRELLAIFERFRLQQM